MKRVHIFGCSFSADYTGDHTVFPSCKKYIETETELGNTEIQDVSYWFKKLFKEKYNEEVIVYNYAKGGNSNDQIFHDFFCNSNRIRPKDYILLQTTFIQRMRVVNLLGKKWTNLQPPVGDEAAAYLNLHTTHTVETVNKICLERASTVYVRYIADIIRFIKRYCNLSNAACCTTALDTDVFSYDLIDLPKVYANLEKIKDKFPNIDDEHLTYDGIGSLVERMVDHLYKENYGYSDDTKKALLSDKDIVSRLDGNKPE